MIKVYDILGKEIMNLVNDKKDAGTYNCSFDAKNLASGVYIYNFQVTETKSKDVFVVSKKMLLSK